MKGKDIIKSLVEDGPQETTAFAQPQRPTGALKTLNITLNQLSEQAATAKALREKLANADAVVELDPADIEASIVSDRLTAPSDAAFDTLKAAIESSGQQVPILVRPHPNLQNRFQAAYGHRRIRAALELGRKVLSIVRSLSDIEMVIAQGQENGPRVDLSFIERSVFANRLEAQGFDRDTICLAIGVDKPEASRLLTVASSIDHTVIAQIGPAPKVGRPRWLQLAEALTSDAARDRVRALFSRESFLSANSDTRFSLVLGAAQKISKKKAVQTTVLKGHGTKLGSLQRSDGRLNLQVGHPAFAAFLASRLDDLIREFEAAQ